LARHRGTQKVRVAPGGPQGQRQELEASQKAIPLPAPNSGGPAPVQGQAGSPVVRPDVFGPTGRPGEPLTAGAAAGPGGDRLGMLPDDPAELLRAVYMQYPSPGVRRLLEKASDQTSGGNNRVPPVA
jgi:hypothetical protein